MFKVLTTRPIYRPLSNSRLDIVDVIESKNSIYVLQPLYLSEDFNTFEIFVDGKKIKEKVNRLLRSFKELNKINLRIVEYEKPYPKLQKFYLALNGLKYEYISLPRSLHGKNLITTLVKNDWQLIPLWVDYYERLGYDSFLIYYNGYISDIGEELYTHLKSKAKVFLVEWPYAYYSQYYHPNPAFEYPTWHRTHAQTLSLNHALYLAKSYFDTITYLDLDEFVVEIGGTMTDKLAYIKKNKGVYQLESRWAELREGKELAPLPKVNNNNTYFLNKSIYGKLTPQKFPDRSKYICTPDSVDLAGVHYPIVVKNESTSEIIPFSELSMFHFHNLSGATRKWETVEHPKTWQFMGDFE